MASKTPRTTVKDYMENVNTEKDAQRTLRRRSVADDPAGTEPASLVPGSASKRQRQLMAAPTARRSPLARRSVGGQDEGEVTPRHLIQNMLTVESTAQPVTRRKGRVSDIVMRPPLSTSTRKMAKRRSSVGGLELEDVTRKFTPRTNILGFLDQAPEMTPDIRLPVTSSDSHSTTQNVSSYISLNVNEVGVSLLERSSSEGAMMNVTASGNRFRSKKRNLNIQLPQATPKLPTETPQSTSKAGNVTRTPGRNITTPSSSAARSSGSSSATSREDGQNKGSGRPNTSAVSEGNRSRSSERNIFHDVLGVAESLSAESVENGPEEHPKMEVERFQGGRKGLTPTVSRISSEGGSIRQGTPQSGGKSQSSQRTLSSMWSPRQTTGTEVNAEAAEEDGLSKSSNNTHTFRFSRRNTENIADVSAPGSAEKQAGRPGTPNTQELSSLKRQKTPQNSSGLDVFSKSPNRTPRSTTSSSQNLRLSALKGSAAKNQSKLGSAAKNQSELSLFSVTGNVPEDIVDLAESPFSASPQRRTPATSTPRAPSRTQLTTPSQLESGSQTSSVKKPSELQRQTPASAQRASVSTSARAKVGSSTGSSATARLGDAGTSSSQRRSRSSAVSRLSGRFDALASASAAAKSDTGGPSVLDIDLADPTTSVFAETMGATGDMQMPEDSPVEADEDEGDAEEVGYSPLKTPRLPAKQPTPATVVRPSALGDRNASLTVGANQAGTKRRAAVSSRPAKRARQGLPTNVIKALFTHFCRLRVSKEAIEEVETMSDQYWRNMAEDLEAFAAHAHRQTINGSDVELLMRRQGFITDTCSLNTLIARYLPLELRQELIPMARSGNQLEPKV